MLRYFILFSIFSHFSLNITLACDLEPTLSPFKLILSETIKSSYLKRKFCHKYIPVEIYEEKCIFKSKKCLAKKETSLNISPRLCLEGTKDYVTAIGFKSFFPTLPPFYEDVEGLSSQNEFQDFLYDLFKWLNDNDTNERNIWDFTVKHKISQKDATQTLKLLAVIFSDDEEYDNESKLFPSSILKELYKKDELYEGLYYWDEENYSILPISDTITTSKDFNPENLMRKEGDSYYQGSDIVPGGALGHIRKKVRELRGEKKLDFYPPGVAEVDYAPYHFYVQAYAAKKMKDLGADLSESVSLPYVVSRAYETDIKNKFNFVDKVTSKVTSIVYNDPSLYEEDKDGRWQRTLATISNEDVSDIYLGLSGAVFGSLVTKNKTDFSKTYINHDDFQKIIREKGDKVLIDQLRIIKRGYEPDFK